MANTAHRIMASTLMLVLLSYSLVSSVIMVRFVLQQDVIAKTKCVQRDNQQGCNGKCQLVIALKKDMDGNQEAPLQNVERFSDLLNFVFPTDCLDVVSEECTVPANPQDPYVYHTLDRYYDIPTPPPIS